MPGAVDEHGEAAESSREELNLFFQLVDEVMAEGGEQRPSKLKVAGSNPAGVATSAHIPLPLHAFFAVG